MATARSFFGYSAEEYEAGIDAEKDRFDSEVAVERGGPFRLVVDGRIAGRFETVRGAIDEETRLHRLAMKDGRQITSTIESN